MAQPDLPQFPGPEPGRGPAPKARPGVVTVAVLLQYATAAVLILAGISLFALKDPVADGLRDFLPQSEGWDDLPQAEQTDILNNLASVIGVFATIAFIILAVFAAVHVILAIFNSKGKNPARILSWITSAIMLACCGLGSLSEVLGGDTPPTDAAAVQQQAAAEKIDELIPAWVNGVWWLALIMSTLGALLIIIFLALPKANEFFRKEQPQHPYM
ncbi:hypothetical protein [Salininema proteolyticum]|uniref:DUF4064 domain-containing protein n=1 Tax=Salininema proteolyticum TaxID=1607685 RepID=A0ABV8TYT3_9ACTN